MKDQGRSMRKRTGGRRRPFRNKKKHELGRQPTETHVGEPKFRVVEGRGNTEKLRAIATNAVTIAKGDGSSVSATIQNVKENNSDPNYARRNIITKGAILVTNEGEVRVTSRPGQDGQVNGVIVE
ncbi:MULTISPECIES: 30S ribosomal protein S8e [unclassified Haladaptatus]|uniref:30S ribosomal protein S8e n=1 Tax=unclassified Haladaptatus TaxID=2622732 RepID=UPI0023E87E96|nr:MULTISPECIES: 30S ribosomal protein S8e [unclassified Haladaptatus]